MASWIIAQMPPHRVYVEPFGGAGSVMLRKERSFAEIWNDLDDEVVNVFRVLRDPESAARLRNLCELTPFSRSEFELSYQETDDAVERARRLLVRSWMGFGASGVRKRRTGFRTNPHRQRTTAAGDWSGWPRSIDVFVARLNGVIIEKRPAAQIIATNDDPHTLFYLDPPYMHASRSQKMGGGRLYHGYEHELTDAEHEQLLDQIVTLRGMVMLSGYGSDLYDGRLHGWRRVTKEARANRGGMRTEVLWLNPAASAAAEKGNVK